MSWQKEIIDQPLHALWSGHAVFVAFFAWSLEQPQWFGVSVLLTVYAALNIVAICVREAWQKRGHVGGIFGNWPWLDTAGYAAGAVVGSLLAVFL